MLASCHIPPVFYCGADIPCPARLSLGQRARHSFTMPAHASVAKAGQATIYRHLATKIGEIRQLTNMMLVVDNLVARSPGFTV